jgi:glycosyltransferase involved in cell wall biosynthesis
MRVLFVSSGLSARFGGAPISEASLAAHLGAHCSVSVLCPTERLDQTFLRQFGVREGHAFRPFDVYSASRGKRTPISDLVDGADLIHLNGHWRWENYFFAALAKKKNIPLVLHPRGMCLVGHRKVWRKKIFNRYLGEAVVKSAAKVILLSQYEAGQLVPYGISADKLAVVPNGITLPPTPDTPTGRGNYFLYYGRLEARKNLLFLLDAFAQYRSQGGTASLWCMGPVERDYDVLLERRSQQLGLRDCFRLKEPTYGGEKWNIIRNSLAVVYPTKDEPFGRVPFEAVAAGVVPIIPENSGGAEYLGRFMPDCLYPQGETARLCEVLGRIEAAAKTGKDLGLSEARAWVARDLNWDRIAGEVFGLYTSLRSQDGQSRHAV